MTFVELPSLGGRDAERPGVTPTQSVGARCQLFGVSNALLRQYPRSLPRFAWECRLDAPRREAARPRRVGHDLR